MSHLRPSKLFYGFSEMIYIFNKIIHFNTSSIYFSKGLKI